MRLIGYGLATAALALGLALSGCGHSDPGVPTLSVTCDGSLMLAGATTINAISTAGNGTTLSFPDPNNADQTATLPVQSGHSCAITPVTGTGKGEGDGAHPHRSGH